MHSVPVLAEAAVEAEEAAALHTLAPRLNNAYARETLTPSQETTMSSPITPNASPVRTVCFSKDRWRISRNPAGSFNGYRRGHSFPTFSGARGTRQCP